jgi:hypothetical protein
MRKYYTKLIESGTGQSASASPRSGSEPKANTLAPQ